VHSHLDEICWASNCDANRASCEAARNLQVQRHVTLMIFANEKLLDGLIKANTQASIHYLAVHACCIQCAGVE
jgi:hypothetical protein